MTTDITIALNEYIQHQQHYEALVEKISLYISDLIENNFSKFIQLLYRLDIDEKHFHQQTTIDTHAIAKIIIAREVQRYQFKQQFKKRPSDANNDELW